MIGNEKGNKAECLAARLLGSKGYNVIKTNFSTRYGEIDIIAQNDEFIVFAEVKARNSNPFVSGIESVSEKKQIRIIKSALMYLQQNDIMLQPRFDVISVLEKDGKTYLKHIEGAFGTDSIQYQ